MILKTLIIISLFLAVFAAGALEDDALDSLTQNLTIRDDNEALARVPKPPVRKTPARRPTRPGKAPPQKNPPGKAPPRKPPAGVTPKYKIPCNVYPDVCLNWCYYAFCKKKSNNAFTVTVDRGAAKRSKSDCAGANKCSASDGQSKKSGWPLNPEKDWSCDEQPKNTNREGGAGAATRCMPATQNSGEGALWRNFINKPGARLNDNTKVIVQLDFSGTPTGVCGPLATPSVAAVCPNPVTKNTPGVDKDGPRQS